MLSPTSPNGDLIIVSALPEMGLKPTHLESPDERVRSLWDRALRPLKESNFVITNPLLASCSFRVPTPFCLCVLPCAQLRELRSGCWTGGCPLPESLNTANEIFTIYSVECCFLNSAFPLLCIPSPERLSSCETETLHPGNNFFITSFSQKRKLGGIGSNYVKTLLFHPLLPVDKWQFEIIPCMRPVPQARYWKGQVSSLTTALCSGCQWDTEEGAPGREDIGNTGKVTRDFRVIRKRQ